MIETNRECLNLLEREDTAIDTSFFRFFRPKIKKCQLSYLVNKNLPDCLDKVLNGYHKMKSYYVGGTLCIDSQVYAVVFMINIRTETFEVVSQKDTTVSFTGLLSVSQLKKAFEIYLVEKGETEYYKGCKNNSCIKHLL